MIPNIYTEEMVRIILFFVWWGKRRVPSDVRKTLSVNLNYLLNRDRLNGSMLARRLGVPRSAVSRWLNAQSYPEAGVIDAMVDTMGWSLIELFGDLGMLRTEKLTIREALDFLNHQDVLLTIKLRTKKKMPKEAPFDQFGHGGELEGFDPGLGEPGINLEIKKRRGKKKE